MAVELVLGPFGRPGELGATERDEDHHQDGDGQEKGSERTRLLRSIASVLVACVLVSGVLVRRVLWLGHGSGIGPARPVLQRRTGPWAVSPW